MKTKKYLALVLCTLAISVYAQEKQKTPLDINDPAPSLYVNEWLKGSPISGFEKGRIYVIEFWATWCRPCIAAMPHLSALASQYKEKITVIGISVHEDENTSVEQIRTFVNNMGDKMNYHVAVDDDKQMLDKWILAAAEKRSGIPRTFVVNAEGKLAWIGHPIDLDGVIQKMVSNNWNIHAASETRREKRYIDSLQTDAGYSLRKYLYSPYTPDSMLVAVEKILLKEPRLKDTYMLAFYGIEALLKIDQKKAYEYGKSILTSTPIGNTPYHGITQVIKKYSDSLTLLPEIYHLGAEAYQKEIDLIGYPEAVNMDRYYANMANFYWKARDRPKAIAAQEKAIVAIKSKENHSLSDLVALESKLLEYKEETAAD